MDVLQVVNTQYAFPIGVVLIGALLVFTFGFRVAEQPAFYRLTHTADDRKPAGKKRKLKDKRTQPNGHAVGSDDHLENKQKFPDVLSKANSGKSGGKTKENKHEADKSPVKDISSKSLIKQQKQNKQDNSPIKENVMKTSAKEVTSKATSSKAVKDKKDAVESVPKQLKEKKQETAEKSPVKEKNNNAQNQIKPSKGKENKVEEIKNKKNEKNLAKLKKSEEKPIDYDDGEWEQAISRKDKKNRKKDEEAVADKSASVKKETGSPSKKKKNKNVDLVLSETLVDEESKVPVEKEKDQQKAPIEKGNEEEKTDALLKSFLEEKDVEVILTPEKKTVEEACASPDPTTKSKKKKKKSTSKATEVDVAEDKIASIVTVEPQPPDTPDKLVVETTVEKTEPKEEVKPKAAEPVKTETENSVAFDELGDVWKEARVPKKSKKKVRKDQ